MKTLLYTVVFLWVIMLPVSGQLLLQSQKGLVSIKQNETECVGNKLILNMDVNLSGLSVGRYASLELTFMLRKGNDSVLLQPIIVNGLNKQKMYKRTLALKGRLVADRDAYVVLKNDPALLQEISYKTTIPFCPWMADAELVLIGKSHNYDNKPVQTFEDVLTKSLKLK